MDTTLLDLLRTARQATEDISLVSDAHGRSVHIERDPEIVGAKKLSIESDGEAPVRTQWHLPATPEPPSLFPRGIPFAPNIPCTILRAHTELFVHWREMACPTPDPAQVAAFKGALPDDLADTVESIHEGAVGSDVGAERAQALTRRLRELWTVEGLSEILNRASTGSEPDPRYVQAFRELVDASLEDDWTENPAHEPLPHECMSAAFRKGEMQRHVSVTCVMGMTAMTLLEGPAPAAQ